MSLSIISIGISFNNFHTFDSYLYTGMVLFCHINLSFIQYKQLSIINTGLTMPLICMYLYVCVCLCKLKILSIAHMGFHNMPVSS